MVGAGLGGGGRWPDPTLANKLGPTLAAGNTLVVKPSELASASVLEFAAAVEGILPDGVPREVAQDARERDQRVDTVPGHYAVC